MQIIFCTKSIERLKNCRKPWLSPPLVCRSILNVSINCVHRHLNASLRSAMLCIWGSWYRRLPCNNGKSFLSSRCLIIGAAYHLVNSALRQIEVIHGRSSTEWNIEKFQNSCRFKLFSLSVPEPWFWSYGMCDGTLRTTILTSFANLKWEIIGRQCCQAVSNGTMLTPVQNCLGKMGWRWFSDNDVVAAIVKIDLQFVLTTTRLTTTRTTQS